MALQSSFYPHTQMLMKKSASAESVISLLLRMLLWRKINVNTAPCEHPCNSLQPLLILLYDYFRFKYVQGFGNKQNTAVSKACIAICCSRLSLESIPESRGIEMHSKNLRIDMELFLHSRCIDLLSQPYFKLYFFALKKFIYFLLYSKENSD